MTTFFEELLAPKADASKRSERRSLRMKAGARLFGGALARLNRNG